MVDGSQIDDIRDATDQQELLKHLRLATAGADGQTRDAVQIAWLSGADPTVAGTLRYIDEDGVLSDTPDVPRESEWHIHRDERRSTGGLLFYRHFSVATNYAHEGMGVGRYSVPFNTGDGFPHGFEVQIVGPSKSRQVLLQLCVVSTQLQGLPAWAQLRTIAQIRDV